MIPVEEATKILEGIKTFPEAEEIPLENALNRILAQDVLSSIDMPPFPKSAMDGYALRADDNSERFRIVEVIPAGYVPRRAIGPGQCAKIMTGGMLPQGADRVVKKEVTSEADGYMTIIGQDNIQNICFQGEDISVGDLVLTKGSRLRPQEIAVAASMGLAKIKVFRQPEVGIMATGSEIIQPGRKLKRGQIYDSNTFSLTAQVKQTGAVVKSRQTAVDKPQEIRHWLKELLDICDVVLVSGGVSVGDYDYVPSILKELGAKLHFEKIAIKPGKPTVFGTREKTFVFGVPGNPVSTFVIFELFIKPLLLRMMGHEWQPVIIKGILAQEIRRKRTERAAYYPVVYKEGQVYPLPYHGSAHIHALTRANGLICLARGQQKIAAGSTVDVRQI